MSKALDLKLGLIRPLSGLITSDRAISPLEERHYLYRQESNFEEMARSQADTADFMRQISEARRDEVANILKANGNLIREQREWRMELSHGFSSLNYSIDWLSSQLERQYQMTEDGFTNVIRGLGIVNGSMEEINRSINIGLSSVIKGICDMTKILEWVHAKLCDIDTKLANPKKVAALESKRTAFEHYSNGWHKEALFELDQSLELAPTDFDCHLLKGVIFLENPDTSVLAVESLENAKKYSEPYDRTKYLASCRTLAKAAYVVGDFAKAFENQFESMEGELSSVQWMALARYAALGGKYAEFEDAAFRLVALDRFATVAFSSDADFTADEDVRAVVSEVVDAISRKEVHAPRSDVWVLAAKQLSNFDDSERSPFMLAMKSGDPELVEGMILIGVPPSSVFSENGKTPLHLAAGWANVGLMRVLVRHGADAEKADMLRNVPLHDLLNDYSKRKEESVMECLNYLTVSKDTSAFATLAIRRMGEKPDFCVSVLEVLRSAGSRFEWANLYSLVADRDSAEPVARYLASIGVDSNMDENFRESDQCRITPKMLQVFKEIGFNPAGKRILSKYWSADEIPKIIAYLDEGAKLDAQCDGLFKLAFLQRNPELFAKLVRAGGIPGKFERSWFLMSAFWRLDDEHREVFQPDSGAGMFVPPKLDREVDQYRTYVPLEWFVMAAKHWLNLSDRIVFSKTPYKDVYPAREYREDVFAEFCYGFKGAFKKGASDSGYYKKVVDEYSKVFAYLSRAKEFSTACTMPGRNYVPPCDCLYELFLIASKNREWGTPVPMGLLIKAVEVSGYYARRNDESGSWAFRVWKADYDKGTAHLCAKYLATESEVNSLNLAFFWPGYSIPKSQLKKMAKESEAKKSASDAKDKPKGFWGRLFG